MQVEKYMIIKPGCNLYNDYFAWKEDEEKVCDIFGRIKKKYGIEATKFYPIKTDFRISTTYGDFDKFDKLLKKTDRCCFKRNTDISKEWRAAVADIDHMERPRLFYYFDLLGKRWVERLFDVDTVLYCSIETDSDFETPDFAEEMKASDFYKIIEDLEEKEESNENK